MFGSRIVILGAQNSFASCCVAISDSGERHPADHRVRPTPESVRKLWAETFSEGGLPLKISHRSALHTITSSIYTWMEGLPNIAKGSCGIVVNFFNNVEHESYNISLEMAPCDHSRSFTCFTRKRTPYVSNDTRCRRGWKTHSMTEYCYLRPNKTAFFDEARHSCEKMEAKLWVPNSYLDMHAITLLLSNPSSGIYIGLRDIDGRTLDLDRYPWSESRLFREYTDPFNQSVVNEKGIRNVSCYFLLGDILSKKNCTELAEFVCQKPKLEINKTVNLDAELSRGRGPLNDDNLFKLRSSSAYDISFFCISNVDQLFLFLRDGIYIESWGSNRLSPMERYFGDHKLISMNILRIQGIYMCETWIESYGRITSKPVSIVFRDIMTIWLYLVMEKINGKDLSVFVMNEEEHTKWSDLLEIPTCMPGKIVCLHLDSVVNNSKENFEVNPTTLMFKIAMYSNISDELDMNYFDHPLSPETRKLEIMLIKKYLKSANSSVVELFISPPYLREKAGRIPSRKRDIYPIPREVESPGSNFNLPSHFDRYFLRSTRGCGQEDIVHDGKTIRFGQGLPEEVLNSTTRCLTSVDLPSLALGRCSGNFNIGYSWRFERFNPCVSQGGAEFKTTAITNKLQDRLNELIDENGTDEVLKQVLNLTFNSSDEMSFADVVVLSTIAEKVAESENVTQEMGKSIVRIVSNVMGVSREDASEENNVKTNNRLVKSLETLVSNVHLKTPNVTWGTENLVVHIVESKEHVKGFGLLSSSRTKDGNKYVYGKGLDRESGNMDVAVYLPEEAYYTRGNKTTAKKHKTRTSFIVYQSQELFASSRCKDENAMNKATVTSYLVESSIKGVAVKDLKNPIRIIFKMFENSTHPPTCVFFDKNVDNKDDSFGWQWSVGGMETIHYNDSNTVECRSDHLTNFAVLAGFCMSPDTFAAKVLRVISIFGTILSIVCLLLLILCQIFFKKFRRGQYQLALLNLAISLIIVNLLVLLGIDRTGNRVGCMVVAALLHYFLLVSFSWMLIEAILQYYKFVKVFDTHVSKFIIKTTLPAWILPGVVVALTGVIDYNQFRGPENYCWLAKNAFHFAFLLPLGLLVTANTVMFIMIVKGITCDRPKGMQTNQSKTHLVWLQVQAGMCCFVIMGLTWCFALFAFGKAALVMQFLFAIFNSLQGVFIFILFNLREKPVRNAWRDFLCKACRPGKKRPKTKETYPFKTQSENDKNMTHSSSDFSRQKNDETGTVSSDLSSRK